MANSSITVFVNFGMDGRGTASFTATPDTLVSTFFQMIIDKEIGSPNIQGVRIIFAGKQLEPVRKGRQLKLSDYGIQNESTTHAAFRLLGGGAAEGTNATHFDAKKVTKLGGDVVKTDCTLQCSDGCSESNFQKCKLSCGCILCADCMKQTLNRQITVGQCVKITCGDSSHGGQELDRLLVYAVAALTIVEMNCKDEILSKNSFERKDAVMSYCPLGKCKRYVFKEGHSTKQQCPACHNFMCWDCKKEWKGAQVAQQGCGNKECDPVAHITLLLGQAPMKQIGGHQMTDTRLCPACYAVCVHDSGCPHITCHVCKHEYCHICLITWPDNGHLSSGCAVAGEQKVTADMLRKK